MMKPWRTPGVIEWQLQASLLCQGQAARYLRSARDLEGGALTKDNSWISLQEVAAQRCAHR